MQHTSYEPTGQDPPMGVQDQAVSMYKKITKEAATIGNPYIFFCLTKLVTLNTWKGEVVQCSAYVEWHGGALVLVGTAF